ncbi:AAA family ATPase [Shimia haliotis]|uniref:Pilus assembly protein CpaE n=1 Tax=Shimia haliotis TaxID=1280847 RepID=A0A1I4F902_9RHOB|nr:AAA family ATPase [Shimia haliotis]SFL13933.1 pilus assembly protein CpaE [Shimia haliotis]
MSSNDAMQTEPSPILACTICRDVQNFELLIVDMEEALGEQWGDLGFEDAIPFMAQPDAHHLEFIALAIDDMDEDDLNVLTDIITEARNRNIRILLIAEDVTPASLHHLLRHGADEFIPYPIPPGELQAAIDKIRSAPSEPEIEQPQQSVKLSTNGESREGVVLAVHGLAGGTGATTLAVNLGWELANIDKKKSPSVCVLDLDLQFGSVSTFLDLPRIESVFELITDTDSMDSESFGQALQTYEEKLHVLTAPSDVIPLDLIGPEDVERLIDMARKHYDYVIIDMPSTLVVWTEVILNAAHVYFATMEIDMRSAQNAMRIKRAFQAEDLPFEKLRYVMNRAPKFTDLAGKSRVKRLAESLGIAIDVHLPDGSKQVGQAADHGQTLAENAPKNPLRKEIAKLAKSLLDLDQTDEQAA